MEAGSDEDEAGQRRGVANDSAVRRSVENLREELERLRQAIEKTHRDQQVVSPSR